MIDKQNNPEPHKEYYDAGIYIKDIKNTIGYSTEGRIHEDIGENAEEKEDENKKNKNQILKT